ncbi:hypothetical protein [Microbulbifer sp. JMSA003]|uniref:hypothetical protein n=1 Tax=unclassified Microbulbifer TaxID=2619833 RepID=UPI00403A118E
MPTLSENNLGISSNSLNRAEKMELDNTNPAGKGGPKPSIISAEDAPSSYRALDSESEDVQNFLKAFAHNNHIYGLINTLNNNLKAVYRDMREGEISIRVNKYIDQFDTALEKRDEIIKYAGEIYDTRMRAANMKMGIGIMHGALGLGSLSGGGGSGGGSPVGSFAQAAQYNIEAKIDRLNAEAERLNSMLQARQVELDAEINLDKQDAELAGAHISLIDNLTSTFSSMINDLHSHHSATVNALSKSIV